MERSQLDEVRALYREHRPLLFSLAYRMLGIVSDAEDVVQDVFSHLNDVNLSSIANKKAYLCKMITNRCLDVLKSARKKRETYVGHWLPEPLPCDLREGGEDPQQSMVHREMVSYAVLALLQQLNPVERAVFFLRESLRLRLRGDRLDAEQNGGKLPKDSQPGQGEDRNGTKPSPA